MLTLELRAAKLPWIGSIAYHYWFVVLRNDRSDRWEVWQSKTVKSHHPRHLSWGHLHYNLMSPQAGVGNGTSWLVTQWHHEAATPLAELIEASPRLYPYCDRYFLWPGPNSNTYVQWILNQWVLNHAPANVTPQGFQLSWRGWGKNFQAIHSPFL